MTSPPDSLLRRLEWHVLRRLDGRVQGAYRTVYLGAGLDFTGLREYTPEDDVRHIDWNVTARLDEPYVRQYAEDRELTAWLVLDRSASMRCGGGSADGGSSGGGKESMLSELAVCLGRLFTRTGNRVGAILYDNGFRRIIPPRTGRGHIRYLANELSAPPVADPDGRTTDLAAMLHLASATVRRRGLVFVISDFIGDGEWEPALIRLGQRHEVITVRIVAPVERALPDVGMILLEDAETGEQVFADTGDPVFQRRLRTEVATREHAIAGSMRRAGVATHLLGTDEDLTRALIRMARGSGRRSI